MTRLSRLKSVIGSAIKSPPISKHLTLPSSKTRNSLKQNPRKTSSLDASQLLHNANPKKHVPLEIYNIVSDSTTTTSHENSIGEARQQRKAVADGSFHVASTLEEINNNENASADSLAVPFAVLQSEATQQQRKETARVRKEKWISNSSSSNVNGAFGRLINICGQKIGTGAAVDIFKTMGRCTAVEDYNTIIKGCLNNVMKSDDEDLLVEQMSVVYDLLKEMKENGFPIKEEAYGPVLQYFVDRGLEEEFYFFLDVIKDKNDVAFPSFGYYEMSLYIRVNKEEKIQELYHYMSTDDSDESAELRENYFLALCDGDRKSEILQLFEVIDVTKVSSANKLAKIFKSLGRLSLESYAEKFLLAFRDHDLGADTISKLIFNYAISAPNLEVEDVVSKFKNLHLFLKMEPHLESYKKMVVYCCEVHEVHVALDVVHQMCEEGLTISEDILNSLLRSIADNLELDLVHRIYSLIRDKDLKPTSATFKTLISLSVKMKEFDSAYAMLDEMKKFSLAPTASLYNIIMAGYFREKNPCAARKIFNQMKLAGVQPDSQTYSYLISNCNSEKKIMEYNKEMELAEIEKTKYICMALISAYASCGQFVKAKEVILDARISNFDTSDLNEIKSILVHALASHGQLHDALNIYEEMKEAGLNVMPKAKIALIEYCQSELDLNGLLKLLEEVQNSEFWMSCCSRVLSFCLHNKHLRPAIDLLKQLENKFQNNELALGVLFDETFAKFPEMESPDLQFAMDLLQTIENEIDVPPSRKCLDFLLSASIKTKDVGHSRLIWKKYKQMGLPYNVMTYLGMYQALLAGGEHQSAKTMLAKIPTVDPDVRTMIQACQRTYPGRSAPIKDKERETEKEEKKKKKKARG